MMKRFNYNQATKALLSAGLLSLALTGCGDDGKDGENGKDGVIGVAIDQTSTLKATFTNATLDAGKLTVDFALENANGVAVLGLTKEHDLRFGIAQLAKVIEKVGEGDAAVDADRGFQWQAYINAKKDPNPSWVPEGDKDISPATKFQANVEAANKCQTCLVDHGDGTYSYTFQTNIANVAEPFPVKFDANNTHRATLELELPQIVANAHYDWQPASGKTEGIQTRDVVSIETCYTCHQPESLALHGGRRIDIENCASCHTYTSGDPESGNSVDFTYMIHAIHKGEDRTTVNADKVEINAPYKVIGYGGGMHDYSKVKFPQKPAANCAACHVEGDGAPANADLFKADLSNTACIACHETPSASHLGVGKDCVSCHNATKPYKGTGSAAKRHGDVMKAFTEAEAMSIKFSDIAADSAGTLTAKMQILDAAGAPVDKAFIDPGKSVYVSVDSDKDFSSYKSVKLSAATFDDASKTYSLIIAGFTPPTANQTIQFYSDLVACFNNGGYGVADVVLTDCATPGVRKVFIQEAPLNMVWGAAGIDTNAKPNIRREIIDAAKCQSCHGPIIYISKYGEHHANGVNCGVCHTPTKPKGGATVVSSSFAWKAHEREGHFQKYQGLQSGTVLKTDCSTCHTDKGITLGRATDRVWLYGDLSNESKTAIYVSSDAGTCLSCHQKYMGDAAKSHIETNGGILDGTSVEDVRTRAKESCSTCHTPEQVFGLHNK